MKLKHDKAPPKSWGSGRKTPPRSSVRPASQLDLDAAVIGGEEMLGEAADRDAEAEGREHLHHADIGLGPHGMADDRKIDEGAEHEHDADDEWRGEHRIERGCRDDAEVAYMASIRNSPWAKFTTSMRPKISERPAAISA